MLGPLPFLVSINDIPNGLKSTSKLFADDKSIFSIVKSKTDSAKHFTHHLSLISKLAFKWKIFYHQDPTKLGQEVIFSKNQR